MHQMRYKKRLQFLLNIVHVYIVSFRCKNLMRELLTNEDLIYENRM